MRIPSAAPKAAGALAGVATAALVALTILAGGVSGAQGTGLGTTLTGLVTRAARACVVTGPVKGLSASQAGYAAQIVAGAFAASGEDRRLARIALMVAITESGLRDLGPLPGNAGSLGLFQQRASEGWGTPAEELNPATSTAMFVRRLLSIPNWRTLPPWVAAEAVQRSVYTNGSNYRAQWARAGAVLASVLTGGNAPRSCGQGVPGGVAGPASRHGLPAGYTIPPGTGAAHAEVVAYALHQLGKPYVWAAVGPRSFDCSGLTMAAWAKAGVTLLHYTVDQQHEGVSVSSARLMAGDLVLVPGSDAPGPGLAGHVGIYLGYGLVESAVDPQLGVTVQSWAGFTSGGLIALRDPDPADG